MILKLLLTSASMLFSLQAVAHPQNIDVDDIVRDARPLLGREIRLESGKCARDMGGKYTCTVKKGNNRIRVESLRLDFQTTQSIRRAISSRCVGEVEKVSEACVFDIVLTINRIRDANGNSDITLSARKINLFKSN